MNVGHLKEAQWTRTTSERVRFDACPCSLPHTLVDLKCDLLTHTGWAASAVTAYVQHKTDGAVQAMTDAFEDAFPPPPATGQTRERKG